MWLQRAGPSGQDGELVGSSLMWRTKFGCHRRICWPGGEAIVGEWVMGYIPVGGEVT